LLVYYPVFPFSWRVHLLHLLFYSESELQQQSLADLVHLGICSRGDNVPQFVQKPRAGYGSDRVILRQVDMLPNGRPGNDGPPDLGWPGYAPDSIIRADCPGMMDRRILAGLVTPPIV